jgi:hypothetical protein
MMKTNAILPMSVFSGILCWALKLDIPLSPQERLERRGALTRECGHYARTAVRERRSLPEPWNVASLEMCEQLRHLGFVQDAVETRACSRCFHDNRCGTNGAEEYLVHMILPRPRTKFDDTFAPPCVTMYCMRWRF